MPFVCKGDVGLETDTTQYSHDLRLQYSSCVILVCNKTPIIPCSDPVPDAIKLRSHFHYYITVTVIVTINT